MQRSRLVVATVCALLLCSLSVIAERLNGSGLASNNRRVWNFDADTVDEPVAGFTRHSGVWRVISDATAPSKPQVLAQLAKSTGSIFNVALVDEGQRRQRSKPHAQFSLTTENAEARRRNNEEESKSVLISISSGFKFSVSPW